jgi:hypothetical protein
LVEDFGHQKSIPEPCVMALRYGISTAISALEIGLEGLYFSNIHDQRMISSSSFVCVNSILLHQAATEDTACQIIASLLKHHAD